MRRLKHLTPRYIVDRTAVSLWQRRNPTAPWLTAGAVGLLIDWIFVGDTVFEWGSGRSTAWFAEHAGRVVSVEHDRTWYEAVGDELARDRGAAREVERHLRETADDIVDTRSQAYVAVIDLLDDESIDLVLVDGLHRDQCAIRAVPKLRPGGLLVVDNADWYLATGSRTPGSRRNNKPSSEGWEGFAALVSTWRRINTTNGVWDTVIWIKPPS